MKMLTSRIVCSTSLLTRKASFIYNYYHSIRSQLTLFIVGNEGETCDLIVSMTKGEMTSSTPVIKVLL